MVTSQTELSTMKANFTAINASIFCLITDAQGTLLAQITSSMGTLTTRLDTINAALAQANRNTATISTSLGEVKTEINDMQTTQDNT
jgi:hypothetical protein